MTVVLVIAAAAVYVVFVVLRPRLGSALACGLFALAGACEAVCGSVTGVVYAAWCTLFCAATPLLLSRPGPPEKEA